MRIWGIFLSELFNKGRLCFTLWEEWSLLNLESSWLTENKSTCCFSLVGFGWTLKPGSIPPEPKQQWWEQEREPEKGLMLN